jgi:hypothetical protein
MDALFAELTAGVLLDTVALLDGVIKDLLARGFAVVAESGWV